MRTSSTSEASFTPAGTRSPRDTSRSSTRSTPAARSTTGFSKLGRWTSGHPRARQSDPQCAERPTRRSARGNHQRRPVEERRRVRDHVVSQRAGHRLSGSRPLQIRNLVTRRRSRAAQCGNPRRQGIAPDIGAYEASAPAPTAHCVVPKLKGKKVTKARKLLSSAHCTLGKVKKPKGKLVVKSQSLAPGTVLSAGRRVAMKLGPKPHPPEGPPERLIGGFAAPE
jgi:hypothetical protein